MLIFKKDTPHFEITLDLKKNELVVKQRWKYNWINGPGTSKWTYAEMKSFHTKVNNLIHSIWGGRFTLKLSAASKIPLNYKPAPIKTYFNIEWVLDNKAHWQVDVTKIPANSFKQSYIVWATRKISLDTEDTQKTLKYISGTKKYYQYGVAHEFGHTIGNVVQTPITHGDEYTPGSAYSGDFPSIMNTGGELRKRHFDFIDQTINGLIPGVKFEVSHVR